MDEAAFPGRKEEKRRGGGERKGEEKVRDRDKSFSTLPFLLLCPLDSSSSSGKNEENK